MKGFIFDLRIVIGKPPLVVWTCVLGWDRITGLERGHQYIFQGKCLEGKTVYVCECRESWYSDSKALEHYYAKGGACSFKSEQRSSLLPMFRYLKQNKPVKKSMIPCISECTGVPELEVCCAFFGNLLGSGALGFLITTKLEAEELWTSIVSGKSFPSDDEDDGNEECGYELLPLTVQLPAKPKKTKPKGKRLAKKRRFDDDDDGANSDISGDMSSSDDDENLPKRDRFGKGIEGERKWFKKHLNVQLISEAIFVKHGFDLDHRLILEISKLLRITKKLFKDSLIWRRECNRNNIVNPYTQKLTTDIWEKADNVYAKALDKVKKHRDVMSKVTEENARLLFEIIVSKHGIHISISHQRHLADLLGVSFPEIKRWLNNATRRKSGSTTNFDKCFTDDLRTQADMLWSRLELLVSRKPDSGNKVEDPTFEIISKIVQIHRSYIPKGLALAIADSLGISQLSFNVYINRIENLKSYGGVIPSTLSSSHEESRYNRVANNHYRSALLAFKKTRKNGFDQMMSIMRYADRVNQVMRQIEENIEHENPIDQETTRVDNDNSASEVSSPESNFEFNFMRYEELIQHLYPSQPWPGIFTFLSDKLGIPTKDLIARQLILYEKLDQNGSQSQVSKSSKSMALLQLFKKHYWNEKFFVRTKITKSKFVLLHILASVSATFPQEALQLLKSLDNNIEMAHVALFRKMAYNEDGSKRSNVPPIPDLNDEEKYELVFQLCQLEALITRKEIATWISKGDNKNQGELSKVQKLALLMICREVGENETITAEVAAYTLRVPIALVNNFLVSYTTNKAAFSCLNDDNLNDEASLLKQLYDDVKTSCYD